MCSETYINSKYSLFASPSKMCHIFEDTTKLQLIRNKKISKTYYESGKYKSFKITDLS